MFAKNQYILICRVRDSQQKTDGLSSKDEINIFKLGFSVEVATIYKFHFFKKISL
jgi:hypothetical protein